jgi:hypothetical protein
VVQLEMKDFQIDLPFEKKGIQLHEIVDEPNHVHCDMTTGVNCRVSTLLSASGPPFLLRI